MILASMKMVLPAKKRDEAIKILKLTAEFCRMQSGCFRCDIHEDLQQKNSILFSSLWSSKEDFEQHLRSDYFRNALLVLEMAEKKPEIRFDEISGSSGMETVEKARQCHR